MKYYGFKASVQPFCNTVETQNFTTEAFEGGIAAAQGIDAALDAFLTGIVQINYDAIPGEIIRTDDPVTDMSWMWQYCSEYGASPIASASRKIPRAQPGLNCDSSVLPLGFYQRGDPDNPLSIETAFRSLGLFQ